ncbi:hypothetical protein JX266_014475, partial [Neoarthrinium moseri]
DDDIQPLLFQPGQGWAYGPGLDWAGRVLEVVLGSTLEQIFQDFMWSSIGLRDTTFFPARRPSLASRRARIYLADGDTFVPKDETPVPLNPRDCLGGLGIWSTPHEFSVFLFHLFVQPTLVKPETLALMSQMDSTAPKLSQDKFLQAFTSSGDVSLFPSTSLKPGIGFSTTEQDMVGRRFKGSAGWLTYTNIHWYAQVYPAVDKDVLQELVSLERDIYRQVKTMAHL